MRTLILNGSPRKNGDSSKLTEYVAKSLNHEVEIINSFSFNGSPCIDCRYCFKHQGCSLNDEMNDIYRSLEEADNIIIISPMHFGMLSGTLLNMLSRLQTYWSGIHIRHDLNEIMTKEKRGFSIINCGGKWLNMELTIEGVLRNLEEHYRLINPLKTIYNKETDKLDPMDNEANVQILNNYIIELNKN